MKCSAFASLALAMLLSACGPASNGTGGDDDDNGNGDPCTPAGAQSRCVGDSFQQCQDGMYVTTDTCGAGEVCSMSLGCTACDPASNQTCVGDDLYVCNDDGTIGGLINSCGVDGCTNNTCGGMDDCSADGTQLIYVVDQDYNLLSFNPAMDMNTFTLIGQLNCPAGAPWPDLAAIGPATPFSMSVDRSGRAWVLYTSGEIFYVSTADASCQASPWVKGTMGYQLFGMGFVADTAGGNTEHLYIAGGGAALGAAMMVPENVASVDPMTLATTTLGPISNFEYSPEFTGTGNAELWAYFPGSTTSGSVVLMDKTTGARTQTYNLPNLSGTVVAWAFAHYGGRYYIFVTTSDALGISMTSQVLRLDPMGNGGAGQVDTIIPNSQYIVVGAGVSTCAPVVIDG